MTSATTDEEKYTLDYFPDDAHSADEPPFKYRTFYLDDVLAEAWRIERGGGRVFGIAQRREPVFDDDELKKALDRMTALKGEHTGLGERKLAALVIDELGKGGSKP